MVKHTQKICRQQPTNCLGVFDYFVELALKGLTESYTKIKETAFQKNAKNCLTSQLLF